MSGTGQVSRALALDVLESAEQLDLSDTHWLVRLLHAATPSIGSERAYGSIGELSSDLGIEIHEAVGDDPAILHATSAQLKINCSDDERRGWWQMRGMCSFRQERRASPNALAVSRRELVRYLGAPMTSATA